MKALFSWLGKAGQRLTEFNMPRNDQVTRDTRLAVAILLPGLGIAVLGALLGLNGWPGADIARAAQGKDGAAILAGLYGYTPAFAVTFWASRPPLRQQQWVLAGWLVTMAVLGWALRSSLPWRLDASGDFSWPMFLTAGLALPSAIALLWRLFRPSDSTLTRRLRWLVGLSLLLMLAPAPIVHLGTALHPLTLDLLAMHFDHLCGLGFTPQLSELVQRTPGLPQLVGTAYGFTPVGMLAVALLQLRGKSPHVASATLVWVAMTACAVLAYHAFPITGPRYVFGSDQFIDALRHAAQQPMQAVQVAAYPRNGMPSMHFGWMLAASMLWWQTSPRPWSRAVLIAMATLTALATLYLGEHYAIDLVVAVPFVLSTIALSSTGVPLATRWPVVAAGFACWLAWVLLLRTQMPSFAATPWLCQLLLLATVAVVLVQIRGLRGFKRASGHAWLASQAARSTNSPLQRRFALMFWLSGAAALVYQVLFAKSLALVFGSMATATLSVLATFLGGMALGSVIGGLLAQRLRAPLRLYAAVEIGIGLYCAATPWLFDAVQTLYVWLAAGSTPDAPALLALRVTLGATVLLLPTLLMGTTLPLLASALGPQGGGMGVRVSGLYFANTAGAAVGALLAAYALMPLLGVRATTLIATALNLIVAWLAIRPTPATEADRADWPAHQLAPAPARSWPRSAGWAAMASLGVVGVLSLGLEVVYVHLLAVVAGNSVYAFGLMLATFLMGLSLGGAAARQVLLSARGDAALALVVSLTGLAITVALGSSFWNDVPGYFGSYAQYPLARGFGARETIRGLVCALVMVPPTVFIGAAYVLAMELVTASGWRSSTMALGAGAAVNTVGNITGVLLFGFVLLPRLGGMATTQGIAMSAALLAALVWLAAARRWRRTGIAMLALSLLALIFGSTQTLDLDQLSSGANVYFQTQNWGHTIDHAESLDGGLTAVTQQQTEQGPLKTLLTNGKFQGNDALKGEMPAQIGFAIAPLLHQPRRDAALVIGYGTGVTSRVLHDAGFARLDIAELSADVLRLADRHFASQNQRVSSQPGVELHTTDGRNFLLLSQRRYDLISIEITSIWFAGAASFYNQEFYRLARERLAPGGVLQQWLQLHHMSRLDLLTVLSTIRAEFSQVSLYAIGGQGILVASNEATQAAPQAASLQALRDTPGLAAVRQLAHRDLDSFANDLLLDTPGIDRFIFDNGIDRSAWLSTDDNLALEYSTPKANAGDNPTTADANRAYLLKYK